MRTADELSLVVPNDTQVPSDKSDGGWSCFKVDEELDFSLTGVLAGLSVVLAEAGIPIFALSTYSTDYLLIKSEKVAAAKQALVSAGYRISE
jgi:hypothetical protein